MHFYMILSCLIYRNAIYEKTDIFYLNSDGKLKLLVRLRYIRWRSDVAFKAYKRWCGILKNGCTYWI